jgi:hypothetical protein
VLVEPGLDALLEARARITELGELDEVLELEVVDVVDQGALARSPGFLSCSLRVPARCPEWDSNPHLIDFESTLSANWSTRAGHSIVGRE